MNCGQRRAIDFDPSYIPKSRRETGSLGWFWSGCANKAKWGLEISGIAVLDLDSHTALHLDVNQNLPLESEILLEFHGCIFKDKKNELKKLAQVVVIERYFPKESFISQLTSCGIDIIYRFRDNVRLRYIIKVKKTGKQGRTKINGETVDFTNMDMKHFRIEKEDEDILIYSALVHTVALNKIVKIANVQILKVGKVALTKVYFSANREIEAWEVLEIY